MDIRIQSIHFDALTVQLLDRGDRDVGKDQLFFPIKEVAPRTLRPHTVFV